MAAQVGDSASAMAQACVQRQAGNHGGRTRGYPQRYAQEALGHNSKAVHQAYAKRAEVEVPSLDDWEKQMSDKIIQLKANSFAPLTSPQTGRH